MHFAVDINRITLSTTLSTILFAAGDITQQQEVGKLDGYFYYSMGVIQGYAIVAGLFKIC